jgi:PadR family transcriptional regulator PadR
MSPRTKAIIPGTVDLLILRTLQDGLRHGFDISRTLRSRSGGVVVLQDGALYQALHRMEREGWIEAEWGLSEKGKRAKFYRLTRRGERQLVAETSHWREYVEAVARILAPTAEVEPAGKQG